MTKADRLDVLVVGAGPAGMAAALAAAEDASLRVGLVDEGREAGGQIWRGQRAARSGGTEGRWRERLRQSGVERYRGCTVFDLHHHHEGFAVHVESERGFETFYASRLVLASGARELFLPFPGWTLPNVVGVGGLQALAKGGFPVRGKRVVIAGSGPLLLAVAVELRRRGAEVIAIAEQSPRAAVLRFGFGLWRNPARWVQAAQLHARLGGIELLHGWWPAKAEGSDRIECVVLTDGRRTRAFSTDHLACAFGLVPNLELADRIGAARSSDGDFVAVDARARTSVAGVFAAGEATGIGGVEKALCEGQVAGYAASGQEERAAVHARRMPRHTGFARRLARAYRLRAELMTLADPETLVCRCEDVPMAALEVYDSWREAKLQTRCGMGSCQGRVCGAALRPLRGWRVFSTRPPLSPVDVGAWIAAPSHGGGSLEAHPEVASP